MLSARKWVLKAFYRVWQWRRVNIGNGAAAARRLSSKVEVGRSCVTGVIYPETVDWLRLVLFLGDRSVYTLQARTAFRSALGFVFIASVLGAFALGAMYLQAGWQSVWRRQSAAAHHPQTFFAIDPNLAKDPSIAAAKLKVVGPLANATKAQDDTNADPNADEQLVPHVSETAPSPATEAPAPETTAPSPAPTLTAREKAELATRFQHQGTLRLFHGRMTVKGCRDLQFEVPAHSSFPRVTGSYQQLGAAQSQQAGLLLLNEAQYGDFLQGTLGDALSSSDAPSGTIDVALKPTQSRAEKYHLLLRGPKKAQISLSADFTVSFE